MLILLSDRLSDARYASIVVDLNKMYSSWIRHQTATDRSRFPVSTLSARTTPTQLRPLAVALVGRRPATGEPCKPMLLVTAKGRLQERTQPPCFHSRAASQEDVSGYGSRALCVLIQSQESETRPPA